MTNTTYLLLVLTIATACQSNEKAAVTTTKPAPRAEVLDGGNRIVFPNDPVTLKFFASDPVSTKAMSADFQAPGHVVATVIAAQGTGGEPLVLFDDPTLTDNYAQLRLHQTNIRQIQNVNIKQKQIELGRAKDLAEHGAATGREVLEAQTQLAMENTSLANERSQLAEHETQLQLGGFDPAALRRARPGQAWLICDVPESQVNKLTVGHTCTIRFTAYPDETLSGRIDAFGDVVDNTTRTIKLRISLDNSRGKYRAGMFATVSFGVSEGNFMSVPQTALITVQGKDYVFVQRSNREFVRREITSGQQINDRVVVFRGVAATELVVTRGTMQLKGLSFGY